MPYGAMKRRLDQQTIAICLREIQRRQRTGIQPNFIVLHGRRPDCHLESRLESLKPSGNKSASTTTERWWRVGTGTITLFHQNTC